MPTARITVVKKLVNMDLIKELATPSFREKSAEGCDRFEVGEVFDVDWDQIPAGFCTWAWADIQRDVASMLMGADAHWVVPKGTIVTCCTDGFRPVVFKVERLSD
jgi:uncharacterized repeat protein (TIGR04076 family)